MTEAVCDLIHLDELDCTDLLEDFESVLVPHQVVREVRRHRPSLRIDQIAGASASGVAISSRAEFGSLVRTLNLGAGEQAAAEGVHHLKLSHLLALQRLATSGP